MQTKQIIQSSANVIRITSISKGNIYKRFDDNYTWLGVVIGVHNDGEKTIIEANEYRQGWDKVEVTHKVIKGSEDYTIFPATLADFNQEFDSVITALNRKIEEAHKTIETSEKQIEFTKQLVSGELQKELSSPEFKEMTQSEFNQKMMELN